MMTADLSSLLSSSPVMALPLVFAGGVLTSLTPCIYPMIPITASLIGGQTAMVGAGVGVGKDEGAPRGRAHPVALTLSYVLGLALVYATLGLVAGLTGTLFGAISTNPWLYFVMANLLVLFALAMLDVVPVRLPQGVARRAATAGSGGRIAGTFVMGAASGLVAAPCSAPVMAAVLTWVALTKSAVLGFVYLFVFSLGMSTLLVAVGLSAGAVTRLPRAGAWMEAVKFFFGVLMLGLALWIVVPVVPGWVPMAGWAALGLGYGAYLIWYKQWGRVSKFIGVAFALLGLVQLVGVLTGGRDPIAPLAHLGRANVMSKAEFTRVKSVADLDAAIARANGKTVMLDFYADWCVSCKEMEKLTFSDPRIKSTFADMVLLQADVTANDEDDKAMLRRFKLFGPPGIIFFDKQGREVQGRRVIGYQDADKFLRSLNLASTS